MTVLYARNRVETGIICIFYEQIERERDQSQSRVTLVYAKAEAPHCNTLQHTFAHFERRVVVELQCVAVCCSVLQCVTNDSRVTLVYTKPEICPNICMSHVTHIWISRVTDLWMSHVTYIRISWKNRSHLKFRGLEFHLICHLGWSLLSFGQGGQDA